MTEPTIVAASPHAIQRCRERFGMAGDSWDIAEFLEWAYLNSREARTDEQRRQFTEGPGGSIRVLDDVTFAGRKLAMVVREIGIPGVGVVVVTCFPVRRTRFIR